MQESLDWTSHRSLYTPAARQRADERRKQQPKRPVISQDEINRERAAVAELRDRRMKLRQSLIEFGRQYRAEHGNQTDDVSDEDTLDPASTEKVERSRVAIDREFVARIFAIAQRIFRVSRVEIKSVRRNKRVVLARHFIEYWLSRRTTYSFPMIGRIMGGRDHTTAMHGARAYVVKRARMGRTLRAAR
ncbi:MAG: hypothetical protein KGL39_44215 [Patescibacteria group bacterium]|nr:hypothetical protein [Patescibacteria group bacterium]